MRELSVKEVRQASGAFSCTFVNNPINWATVGAMALGGAIRGCSWPGAIVGGGLAYVEQKWICR